MIKMNGSKWKMMMTGVASAVLIFGAAMAFPFTSFAAAGSAAYDANVRSSASSDASIVGSVKSGDTLDLVGQETGTDGKSWYKVTTGGGNTGFIRADLVKASEAVAAEDTADTAGKNVMNDEPDSADTAGKNVMNDEPATADTATADTATADTAANTAAADTAAAPAAEVPTAQAEGYAQPMAPTNATISDDVNIRCGAGTNYTQIGKLTKDTALVCIGQALDGDGKVWYQFYTTGTDQQMTGFARSDYVTLGDAAAALTPEVSEEAVAEEPTQPNDYEAVYIADDAGVDTWYLYNNVEGTREKISDIDAMVDQAAANDAANAKTISTYRIVVIALAVVLVILLIILTILILKIRDLSYDDAMHPYGGEVDLMEARKRERRVNQNVDDISDLETDPTGRSRTGRDRSNPYPSRGASRDGQATGRPMSRDGQPAGRPVSRDGQPAGRPVSRDGQPAGRPMSRDGQAAGRPMSRDGQSAGRPMSRDGQAAGRPMSRDGQPAGRPMSRDGQPAGRPMSRDGQPATRPMDRSARPQGRMDADLYNEQDDYDGLTTPQQSRGSKAKNFVVDDDFEFEFLNMDDNK